MATAASEVAAVTLREVVFAYPSERGSSRTVLTGASFSIPKGVVAGLVGRNASGKSTLLRLIQGQLHPQSGDVLLGGTKQSGGATVPLVPQQPDAGLCPTLTVFENCALTPVTPGSSFGWVRSRSKRARCEELLRTAGLGLESCLDEQTRFLSGGQQQALSVLLAVSSLSQSCPLLLMDEPTASLDECTAEMVMTLAIREARERQGAILLVSHRLEEVARRCEMVFGVRDGLVEQLVGFGEAQASAEGLLRFLVK